MIRGLCLISFFIALSAPLYAQGVRASDTLLSETDTMDRLSGQVVEFFDGSKARYARDGRYAYTYTDDQDPFTGTFTASDGGVVCVTFENGFARCDTYVLSGERLVLIIEDGTRFPVERVTPLPE